MKIFGALIVLALAAILRLNLPGNAVNSNYIESGETGLVAELKEKIFYSDVVADWMYKDFLFVKFACSERMKVELIALPFRKWEVSDNNVSECTGTP